MGEGGAGGIGDFVQEHPGLLIGGAVGLGLLFFMSAGSRGTTSQETGLVPVSQETGEGYMTTDEFNAALEEYDSRIREYIDRALQEGDTPPPTPNPGYQGSGDNGPPSGGQPPNPGPNPGGFNWPGHQGPYGIQGDPPCPPGYHWSTVAGTCVQNDPFGR